MGRRASGHQGDFRILIADTDADWVKTLVTGFRRRGLVARHATRGDHAIRLARAHRFSLVMVDVTLEDMTGYELVNYLKAIDRRIPLVMTIGDHRAECEIQARQAGVIYYAPKPIEVSRLVALASRVIASASPADFEPALATGLAGFGTDIER